MTSAQRRWIGLALGVVLALPLLVPLALHLRVRRSVDRLRARIDAGHERHAGAGPHVRGRLSSPCLVESSLVAAGAADLSDEALMAAVERALDCESSWAVPSFPASAVFDAFLRAGSRLENDACLRHAVLSFRLADRLSAGRPPLRGLPIQTLVSCADISSESARSAALGQILPLALEPLPLWHATHPAALSTAGVCAGGLESMVSTGVLIGSARNAVSSPNAAHSYFETLTRLERDAERSLVLLDFPPSSAEDAAKMRLAAHGLDYGGLARTNHLDASIEDALSFRQHMRVAAVALGAHPADPRLSSVYTGAPMVVERGAGGLSVTYAPYSWSPTHTVRAADRRSRPMRPVR
ncbi:MAG: hypothetical protein J0L92_37260 [Deltaproteobacteria bacterium]|nr:hypothetical protein [Deltaproteobacteria bacterium]